MPNNAFSDKELVGQVVSDRTDLFGQLVERHIHGAYAIAYARVGNATDAEDAVQEAFLRALEKLRSLRDPAKFGSWLLSIARNEAVRLSTQRARSTGDPLAATPAITPDVSSREMNALVREQVMRLPEQHREVLLLHYFTGRSTHEIAELLDLRRGAVLKRLQRAREQLAETMLRDLEDARPSEVSFTKQAARIVALASTASVGSAITGTATVSAAASLLLPKAATIAAGVIGATVTLAGIAGFVQYAQKQPTYAQREQAPRAPESRSAAANTTPSEPPAAATASASEEAQQTVVSTPAEEAPGERKQLTGARSGQVDLDQRVSMAFEDVHLAQALLFLEEVTPARFLIDRRAVGVPGKPVPAAPPAMRPYPSDGKIEKARADNQPLGEALDRILADAGLKMVLAPGYLWVSTPDQIRRDGKSYSRARYENYSDTLTPAVLEKPIRVEFNRVHVSEVLQFINEIYDINIILDSRVIASAKGPYETPTFSSPKCTNGKIQYINLKGPRLEDALLALTRLTDLTFSVRKDYIWISSAQMLRRDGLLPLPPDQHKEMDRYLSSPITIAFEAVQLAEILQFIREIYEVPLALDQRVVAWKDEPISAAPAVAAEKSVDDMSHGLLDYINVKNISLSSALDILTRNLDLAYQVRGNDVIISNAKRLVVPGPDSSDLVPAKAFADLIKEAILRRNTELTDLRLRSLFNKPETATPQPAQSRPPHLIQIQKVSDGYRALIDTGIRPDWFAEGELFGDYMLVQIDTKAGCVELLNGKSGKSERICGVTSKF